MTFRNMLLAGAGFFILAACTHTIRIEPSDKPIKIDLNITQEVRIILDKEVEELIADNPDLF
ncbi:MULTISPECIES: YnbE family lipoprotein [Hyphomonas]|uniref:YnbE family lipoprotein n=2 Tax=Hyphomonas adhaerens TaxID=81029 RepID=A0A3B9GZC6_9PROT|nr:MULTISPECIES: YnbE family lipoprotein [Hyphomonas]KCZ85542.1 putative lipoprotein [Hyphomonas adhaerens MHS-3]MBB41353.1 YnbE family lipoprotein [Hyphomonas sp.]HAE27738.1 YnbE family lipoprotein [Hyphomonas adhaerens]|tara:strand:- start:7665 stop:7850 length:186 start_codon:yes stop_codon:yes gene_type:complete